MKSAIMMGMLSHKKIRHWGLFLLLIAAVFSFTPASALAAINPTNTLPANNITAVIADITSMIISVINVLIWIVFIFLNYILDPAFIFDMDGSGSFMTLLNTLWQFSRDLMNVVFALMLIGAAVYSIVTQDKEFVTSHMKKFVLAVVLVNFSWFFPRVIIDISNIATSTIYGLPTLLFENSGANQCSYTSASKKGNSTCTEIEAADPALGIPAIYKCNCQMVTDFKIFVDDKTIKTLLPPPKGSNTSGSNWQCQAGIVCYEMSPWDPSIVAGHSAVLNGLIVNYGHLRTMAQVPPPIQTSDIGKIMLFMMREAFILLIHIALFFPLLAMFVAFVIRIPVLWLTMAGMPFIFLSWTIPGEYGQLGSKVWDHFIKAAFLPAMVAIPLSVGFILINAGSQLKGGQMGKLPIMLIDDIGTFHQLFWWMMSLGVLWVGVFYVLENHGGAMAKGSSAIKGFGETLGKIAVKGPLSNIPIPGPGGKSISMFQAAKLPGQALGAIERGDSMGKFLNDYKGGKTSRDEHNKSSVDKIVGDDVKLRSLHTDLESLKTALQTNNETLKNSTLQKIRDSHEIDLSKGDLHGDLETVLDRLEEKGLKQNNGTRFNQFRNTIDDIKRTATPAAPTPPAAPAPAPAPTGAPPPPPAGGPPARP